MTAQGPLLILAQHLRVRLDQATETLDLDELDRMARRYARAPASDYPAALDALADLATAYPQVFTGRDLNFDPPRLRELADRGRALLLLRPLVDRFQQVVADSGQELGDEAVILLEMALPLVPHLRGEACEVLTAYQHRVVTEDAHQSEAQRQKQAEKEPAPKVPPPEPSPAQQLLFAELDRPGDAAARSPHDPPCPDGAAQKEPAATDTAAPERPPEQDGPANQVDVHRDPKPGNVIPPPAAPPAPRRPPPRFGRLRPLDLSTLARLLDVPQDQQQRAAEEALPLQPDGGLR
jgi:hypothetical protein